MKYLQKMTEKFLRLLYPPKCPLCGELSDGICGQCWKEYPLIQEPRCMKCGKPIKKDTEEYCFDCQKRRHHYEWGKSLWLHRGAVSDAIYAFKYKNRRIYGKIFAGELAKAYGKLFKQQGVDLIIPVPLHYSRQCQRGYNQAEILAEFLGEYLQIEVDSESLIRIRKTNPQKQNNDKERARNIKNAFALKKRIYAKNVLIVDDIYTTGSTVDEVAKTLKKGGVCNVFFLTISIGQGY